MSLKSINHYSNLLYLLYALNVLSFEEYFDIVLEVDGHKDTI